MMRRGQVALYLVLALVALTVFCLADASAFLAVRAKNRAMNAGDMASLASARVQGELLNRIGHLNLEHALAEYEGDWARAREIVEEQRRLCFLGPIEALRAAEAAARDNGATESSEMAGILRQHVSDIYSKYMRYPEFYPEPWEGAWSAYASALNTVVDEGIVAGTENIDFIDMVECFPLTSKSFYAAVEGESWCKFVVAGWEDLLNMDSHNLPQPSAKCGAAAVNSEICSLHLKMAPLPPLSAKCLKELRELLGRNGITFPDDRPPAADTRAPDDEGRLYFFYDLSVWRKWNEMDPTGKFRFPIRGKVKPVFDVMGCTSVFRVVERVPRLLGESFANNVWSAAAKPFGTIQTLKGPQAVTAEEAMGFVLPAFEAVRLIPLSAAYVDCNDTSTADAAWLDHVRRHLASYFKDGIEHLPLSCPYCSVLRRWEDPKFRAKIADWISANGESCRRPPPKGGPGPVDTGGTPYAH